MDHWMQNCLSALLNCDCNVLVIWPRHLLHANVKPATLASRHLGEMHVGS